MSHTPESLSDASLPEEAYAAVFDAAINQEYMPSQRVPQAAAYFKAWAQDSAAARAAHPPQVLAYGPGAQERLDIFAEEGARATVLFIHGGYWQAFHRDHFSYLAPPLLAAGLRVAVMDYDLMPAVTLDHIVDQARRATVRVAQEFPEPLIVAGHSAGGHLAAMVHATRWAEHGLPPVALAGGIGISGLYDLGPLRLTELQPVLQLSAAQATSLSPAFTPPTSPAPFVVAVGELESAAFHQQSLVLTQQWPGVAHGVPPLVGRHHFDAPDELLALALPLLAGH
ncbi:alpha/beta hydrolase [Deinococcus aerophilus]|uniref:Alpha/beta hydrolase n=1 Tax=Deinococcus aerophilus TaxID=522488 RepID=A0ABQ2GJ12_9DEIO|nr:alpha/beta hydrolase [Deinococcus aerophilus]GGL98869.1 alpha/beta hydrolase [Deinococcus aerophilus]